MNDVTLEVLKKQYRLHALLYHPDKNKSPDASAKFQLINDSYQYLLKYTNESYCNDNVDDSDDNAYDEDDDEIDKTSYQGYLYLFMKNIMRHDMQRGLISMIIQKISSMCENKALEMLEKIDKNVLIRLCDIIKKYREVFHFSSDFFDRIDDIISKKIEKDECFILNPLLDDLFENNIYKLRVYSHTYFVPLWHHELIYDNSGNDIYVKCFPILPENITIDNNNNIHVDLSYNILEIWNQEIIEIKLGKKIVALNTCELKLMKKQTFVYCREGISKINTVDIYDIGRKGDIILHIDLFLS